MKKYIIFTLFLLLFAAGCTEKKEEKTITNSLDQLIVDETITNVFLPTEIDGYSIIWSTSDEPFLFGNTIIRGENDTTITLTATIKDSDTEVSKDFVVFIEKNPNYINVDLEHIKTVIATKIVIPDSTDLDIILSPYIDGVQISWDSTNTDYIDDSGNITRPSFEIGTQTIDLLATFKYKDAVYTKTFSIQVLSLDETVNPDVELVNTVIESIIIPTTTTSSLTLPTTKDGVSISWTSNTSNVISNTGVVSRPASDSVDATVILTATYTKGEETKSVVYTVLIPKKSDSALILSEYYTGAEDLEGDLLKAFLHDLIDDHQTYSYAFLWEALAKTDEDPNNPNNVILFYTGRSQSKEDHGGAVDEWNREHVWAKSHGDFGNLVGPGTDMHHIRPTDVSVNGARAALDFDEGGSIVYDGSIATLNFKDGDSFEPRDEVKGDVARIIFYMVVRYEGDDGWPDLEMNDLVNNGGPYMGKLSILLQWHLEDPPNEFEMNRNDIIESYQGNRNPFIDYPEFADLIWGN